MLISADITALRIMTHDNFVKQYRNGGTPKLTEVQSEDLSDTMTYRGSRGYDPGYTVESDGRGNKVIKWIPER